MIKIVKFLKVGDKISQLKNEGTKSINIKK